MFRHQFHQKYFVVLSILVVVAASIAFLLLFFIRQKLFFTGLAVGGLTFLYILFNRWFIYTKELTGASLYCVGIFLPTFTFQQKIFIVFDWIVVVQFFLIALTNLILFSWMDYEEDKRDCHSSLSTQIGKKGVTLILRFLFLVILVLTGYIFLRQSTLGLIYLAMVLVLLMAFLFPTYFKKQSRYRFWGDAIFFFPILFML
jgi:4-hydroxybenzoate polyprenyltransferase